MIRNIIIISLIVYSSTALALGGRIVGNGGDVVVCKDAQNNITSIDLLDHFEARSLRGLSIDFGVQSDSVSERVYAAITRLQWLSPDRAKKYRQWANTFNSETNITTDVELVDIPDSQHSGIPRGCKPLQIANQATVLLPGQKRYIIDKTLWDLLNPDQKAGLILHEIVYRETLSFGQENSIAARFLSSLMASPTITELKLKQFIELLQQLGFPSIRAQGVLIQILDATEDGFTQRAVKFSSAGRIKSATVVYGSFYLNSELGYSLPLRNEVTFDEYGFLSEAYLARPIEFTYKEQTLNLDAQIIRLYRNGFLKLAVLSAPKTITEGAFSLELTGHISFHPNGSLFEARISPSVWLSPWGPKRINRLIKLYENGDPLILELISGTLPVGNRRLAVSNYTQFYPGNKISSVYLKEFSEYLSVQNKKVYPYTVNSIDLYPSGNLKGFTLNKKTKLKTSLYNDQTFQQGQRLTLSEAGLVLAAD